MNELPDGGFLPPARVDHLLELLVHEGHGGGEVSVESVR